MIYQDEIHAQHFAGAVHLFLMMHSLALLLSRFSPQLPPLRGSNSPLPPRGPLPRVESAILLLRHRVLGLRDRLCAFRQDHLDVARVAHVGIDAAVGAVRAAALLRCLVDLDVLHDQVGGVEPFDVGVGFGVFKEAEEEFGGFDGVAGFGDAELFACGRDGLVR
jgi:hypothetical protein